MSDFNYDPLYGATITHAPRVRLAQFGDGYEQRVADGINTDPEIWDVEFTKSKADIDTFENQLKGYNGVTAFTWTPHGHSEIKVVCRGWTRIKRTSGVDTLTARFEQVFEA